MINSHSATVVDVLVKMMADNCSRYNRYIQTVLIFYTEDHSCCFLILTVMNETASLAPTSLMLLWLWYYWDGHAQTCNTRELAQNHWVNHKREMNWLATKHGTIKNGKKTAAAEKQENSSLWSAKENRERKRKNKTEEQESTVVWIHGKREKQGNWKVEVEEGRNVRRTEGQGKR